MRDVTGPLGAALVAALLVATPVQTPCMHYSPAVVTLEGALLRRRTPGPAPSARPGARTAREDSALFLALSAPICVAPDSVTPDADKRLESGVRELLVAIGSDSVWAELEAARRLRVRVTGELFHAPAGRPRPAIVVWVLRAAPAE